jgi:Flp pilus assembly protein TadG
MTLIRSEKGAALVEFAVVAPVLAFLLVGIIDFGRYTYDGILAANAARAAASYGAQNLTTAEDTTTMQTVGQEDSQGLTLTVTPTVVCMSGSTVVTCGTSGETVYVNVKTSGSYSPLIRYAGMPSTTLTVSGSATMRVEAQ